MLKYLRYQTGDLTNGDGIRCTLYVSGCNHFCKGCHNPVTWNARNGHPVCDELIEQIIKDLKDHTGFSLSGGDPLFPPNREPVAALLKRIKEAHPDKDIWLWTGYRYEEVKDLEALRYVDVLIDGRYDQSKPTLKPWRGSDNQELIRL